MCGIAGIVSKNGVPVDSGDLKMMTDAVKHRGPDGEGYFLDSKVGFGHRRLAIIDLSQAGHQPMQNENLVITFNGEIYNYIEIREELEKEGATFSTQTDTEVILKAYQHWGRVCVEKFNGMWAFAIYDNVQNLIFISRDRFGIKPLYYHKTDRSFLFGSEIRQLLPFIKNRKVNKQILFDFLYLGYHHHNDDTFFENVNSLTPGHNIIYDLTKDSYKIERYYDLSYNKDFANLSFDGALEKFTEAIDKAISLRLRSDVKVGTCLSGGMDSSYIAARASEFYSKDSEERFMAITAKSIESFNDESEYAKMVVENCNLDWKVTQPSKQDFLEAVDQVIEAQEEPFGSPSIIMSYFVMKKAKEEKCTVLLDGQGGDESLLGYDRYFAAFVSQQKGLFSKIKRAIEVSRNSKLSLKDVFLYNFYFNNATIRYLRQSKRYNYIKPEFKRFINKELLYTVAQANKDVRKLQKFEITKVQLQKLLKFEDRNSMHFSIETRVPFVDYKLVELAYSLPFSYKMHKGWSKYILRQSAKGKLPEQIVWRRNKFGFEAPTKTWLSEKDNFISEIKSSSFVKEFVNMEKLDSKIDHIALWKLYNICVWAKKFDVQFL